MILGLERAHPIEGPRGRLGGGFAKQQFSDAPEVLSLAAFAVPRERLDGANGLAVLLALAPEDCCSPRARGSPGATAVWTALLATESSLTSPRRRAVLNALSTYWNASTRPLTNILAGVVAQRKLRRLHDRRTAYRPASQIPTSRPVSHPPTYRVASLLPPDLLTSRPT